MSCWLTAWRRAPCSLDEAWERFDRLPAVAMPEMIGRWRGSSCPTGHDLDGLLEALGWYGKAFEPPDRAHPLLFRRGAAGLVALDPSLLPTGLARRWPALARRAAVRATFRATLPLLATTRPAASLRRAPYRGVDSTAMAYHRQPIVDHFRRASADRLLGVMEAAGQPPFFFLLERDLGCAGPASS